MDARPSETASGPDLTFSQIAKLEFCSYRYYLECIRNITPQSTKAAERGSLFHSALAEYYRSLLNQRPIGLEALHALVSEVGSHDRIFLQNALALAVRHSHGSWTVIAVEQAFRIPLGDTLPHCVGVVDLILRKGEEFAVVDHKTGTELIQPDPLQVSIYAEYVRRTYQVPTCRGIVDSYRWVKNLHTFRAPAFRRTRCTLREQNWPKTLDHLRRAHAKMRRIKETDGAPATGKCFRCPLDAQCPKSRSRNRGFS